MKYCEKFSLVGYRNAGRDKFGIKMLAQQDIRLSSKSLKILEGAQGKLHEKKEKNKVRE